MFLATDYQVEKNVFLGNGRAFSFGRNSWGELGLSHRMAVGKPNCIKSNNISSFVIKTIFFFVIIPIFSFLFANQV